jgi:hypothetical protein
MDSNLVQYTLQLWQYPLKLYAFLKFSKNNFQIIKFVKENMEIFKKVLFVEN